MNCKRHSLVYVAKLIDWNDRVSGAHGTFDIRGVVFKILDLRPGTPQWMLEKPLRVDKSSLGSDGRIHEFHGHMLAIGDEYLRPFGDPDFNETIETTKEVTT